MAGMTPRPFVRLTMPSRTGAFSTSENVLVALKIAGYLLLLTEVSETWRKNRLFALRRHPKNGFAPPPYFCVEQRITRIGHSLMRRLEQHRPIGGLVPDRPGMFAPTGRRRLYCVRAVPPCHHRAREKMRKRRACLLRRRCAPTLRSAQCARESAVRFPPVQPWLC